MFFSGIGDEAGVSLDDQIRAHRELGWKHIEVRNVDGVNLTDLSDEAFEEAADRLSSAGIAVSCFASQLCNWSRPITRHADIDRQELARALPRMRELGCRFIRVMSYPNAGWPEEKWRGEALARLKGLVWMAEEADVVLVHENCDGWGAQGHEQTLELLEQVGSENLKLLWDTGNPVAYGQDPWDYYEAVRQHVVYVHIMDAVMENGEVRYTFPGEGDGRVRDVVRDLLKHGYEGGFSIEPHMKAIVHEDREAAGGAYEVYVEYGQRFMRLVEQVR